MYPLPPTIPPSDSVRLRSQTAADAAGEPAAAAHPAGGAEAALRAADELPAQGGRRHVSGNLQTEHTVFGSTKDSLYAHSDGLNVFFCGKSDC